MEPHDADPFPARSPPPGPGCPGLRPPATGRHSPSAIAGAAGCARRGADRLGERPGALPLPAGFLPPRRLRPRTAGRPGLGQAPAPRAIRVLGPRGFAAAAGALSAAALAHAPGRQWPGDLPATGAFRFRATRGDPAGAAGRARAGCPRRGRPEHPRRAGRALVGLERGKARAGVAVRRRRGDGGRAPGLRAPLRPAGARHSHRPAEPARYARGRCPASAIAARRRRPGRGHRARPARLLSPGNR
ncbi:hypothetical protein FQZ97_654290 [compost metagenome]